VIFFYKGISIVEIPANFENGALAPSKKAGRTINTADEAISTTPTPSKYTPLIAPLVHRSPLSLTSKFLLPLTASTMASDESTQPLPSVPDSISDVSAARTAATFQWSQVIELGYVESADGDGANVENEEAVCFNCGMKACNDVDAVNSSRLLQCSRCQVASYW